MAQQVINVGTAPNDGTGDPLRTAYIKTNSNFGELYNRVQTTPPASLTGSIGDTAGMYAYDNNYFYYCYANFNGSTQIWNQITNTGNVTVTSIASGNSTIGFNNINGNAAIGIRGVGNVAVFSNTAVNIAGNVSATGNLTGGNLNTVSIYATGLISAAGTVTGNYFVGNGAFLTGITTTYGNANVATYLPTYTGGFANLLGNVTTTANVQGAYVLGNGSQLTGLPATYGNANVATYLAGSAGNIIPAANVSYSLGSSAYQWKDLWVSNSTIYINSVAVSINASNTLTVGGQAVLTNGGNTAISTTGNVSAANISATGNITGSYILGNGSLLTGIVTSSYGNSNVASYLPTYSGNITAGNITISNAVSSSTVSATGNITGNYILGNGSQLTGITANLVGTVSSANVSYLANYTGSVTRTGNNKWSDIVSVRDFGAVGNGVANDTAAVQAAINTGKRVYVPTGTYRLSTALVFNTPGQMMSGDGRTGTIFLVDNINYSFNLGATGVFVFSTGEPGPQLDNLQIKFVQPTTSNRASLIAYPPAIYAQNIPRFSIYNCRIVQGMTGIDMRQNSGGATIDGLEMSCYSYGVRIDGSLDSVRIIRLQYWPFDIAGTANESIYFDANNRGVESGRCDDLKIEDCLFINGGIQLSLISTASGTTFGVCSNTDFDTYGYVNMAGGQMSFVNCYWTIGNANYQAIVVSGGILRVDCCDFQAAVALTNYMIAVSGGSTYTQITGCTFQNSGPGGGYIVVTAGDAIVNGNKFVTGANQVWTNSLIYINGSSPRATVVNNRSTDKGTGTGKFVIVTNDNWHMICNNVGIGWGYTYPGSYTQMIAANNS